MGVLLCYVQEMEADWDSNDLHETYLLVDKQIQSTLNRAVSSFAEGSPGDGEMEGEFAAYWLPNEAVYLLSDAAEFKHLQCRVAVRKNSQQLPGVNQDEEWIAYHEDHVGECDEWMRQRGLVARDGKNFLTSYFKVEPSRLAGVLWPPEDFKTVLQWLSDVDPEAKARILDHFPKNPVKHHVLLLDVKGQDMIGLYLALNQTATAINTYRGKRKAKHSHLASVLSGKQAFVRFMRLGVIKADRKTILSRNRPRPEVGDLSKKRIALIGCGTVGGYLSGLLLRAGAGCGQGYLHLFDHDVVQPHNFGRHPLTTADFGQNKAVAMASTLRSSSHLASNIEGQGSSFSVRPELLKKYDIIIDATGRPPVSKRLAHVVRTMPVAERPILVHGFNDGNGRASKVVVDDGSCCIGCLFADPAFYRNGVDLRFEGIDHKAERHISCGSTYTPYDAAVSVITASLIQQAVLNTLEPKGSWTYSEHMLDGNRSRQPRRLPCHPNCEICHGQRRADV